MIYWILKQIAGLTFKIYFDRIYLHNAESTPRDQAVILASNHPSAFLEPCILASFLPRPLWFLTRGDFFNHPLLSEFLRHTHQLPIYRSQDGFEKLRANTVSFQQCYEHLREKKTILIFSEASSELEPRLRPIRKGTAKLALGAFEMYPDIALYLQPVAINYVDPRTAGTAAMIDFCEPIAVHEIWKKQQGDTIRSIAEVTELLKTALKEHVAHIDNPEYDRLYTGLLEMVLVMPSGFHFPPVSTSSKPRKIACTLARRINTMPPSARQELIDALNAYRDSLHSAGLHDREIARYRRGVFRWLQSLISIVIYGVGYIGNILPATLSQRLTDRIVKRSPFYAPVFILFNMLFFSVYYLILFVAGFILAGWEGIFVVMLLVMCGYFALKSGIRPLSRIRLLFLSIRQGNRLKRIIADRQDLIQVALGKN